MDLTKKRLSLLNDAARLVESMGCVDFVFADINCNTVTKLTEGKFLFFNSISKLEEKFRDLIDSKDDNGQAKGLFFFFFLFSILRFHSHVGTFCGLSRSSCRTIVALQKCATGALR